MRLISGGSVVLVGGPGESEATMEETLRFESPVQILFRGVKKDTEVTREVLEAALALERTRTGGLPTKIDNRFEIHGKHGFPCPRCGADLRRVSYEGYEISYCPECQTGGKVLADRRMSRLIR